MPVRMFIKTIKWSVPPGFGNTKVSRKKNIQEGYEENKDMILYSFSLNKSGQEYYRSTKIL